MLENDYAQSEEAAKLSHISSSEICAYLLISNELFKLTQQQDKGIVLT